MKSTAILMGFVILFVIGLYYYGSHPAEATHANPDNVWQQTVEELQHILKEEQKQTNLLQQTNCYAFYSNNGYLYPTNVKIKYCGIPLNYTEVINP